MSEFSGNGHVDESVKSDTDFTEISTDGIFSIKVSEDMRIRNILRNGLVEAQGKNGEKIPMFVSWPHWLDDGIVCLFARDLHAVLADTVHNTVLTINKDLEYPDFGENNNFGASEDGAVLSDIDEFIPESDLNESFRTKMEFGEDEQAENSIGDTIPTSRSKIIKGNKFKI